MMITGDHIITARAIGEKLGLLRSGRSAITGRELAGLSERELRARITSIAIVARATPDSKVRVIDAWRARGVIVAMAGDGVNDAPALRNADVGCAMGRGGTDVARDAADIVIVDDHFATIVDAVEEGRRTHHNLRKAVAFLLSTNIGEVVLLVLAVAAGLPAPLTAAQILLINLITDGAPALALAADPADRDAMTRPPATPALTSRSDVARLVLQGITFGGVALLAFLLADPLTDLARAQTVAFTTLAFSQVLHSFSARFTTRTIFGRHTLNNVPLLVTAALSIALTVVLTTAPGLSTVLGFVALPPGELAACAALAASTLGAVEAAKFVRRRLAQHR